MLDNDIIGARIDPRNNNLTKNNMTRLGPNHTESPDAADGMTIRPHAYKAGEVVAAPSFVAHVGPGGLLLKPAADANLHAMDRVSRNEGKGAMGIGDAALGDLETGLRFVFQQVAAAAPSAVATGADQSEPEADDKGDALDHVAGSIEISKSGTPFMRPRGGKSITRIAD